MKRAAVFIGTDHYRDSSINGLDCAESDAVELYSFFKYLPGYCDVRLLLRPDSGKILDVINEVTANLSEEDLILVYFAGHDVELNGNRILLCSQVNHSRIDCLLHTLPLDLLLKDISGMVMNQVIILDTARKSLLRYQQDAKFAVTSSPPSIMKALETYGNAGCSLSIVSTCSPGQYSLELTERNQGVFTYAFIEALKDGICSQAPIELSDELMSSVAKYSREISQKYLLPFMQIPWIATTAKILIELLPGKCESRFYGRLAFKEVRIKDLLGRRFRPGQPVNQDKFPDLSINIVDRLQGNLAAGAFHSLCIDVTGHIAVAGSIQPSTEKGYCLWRKMKSVAAGCFYSIGLRQDGRVYCDAPPYVSDSADWQDIVAVDAGSCHVVGLRKDGRVLATGDNSSKQCDVASWSDIRAISAGEYHTVGLKSDGTVVAVGYSEHDACSTDKWQDIIAISAGNNHTVGLRSDGTVVAVGDNEQEQCEVANWTSIAYIKASFAGTLGIKNDGTIVFTGEACSHCENIMNMGHLSAVAYGGDHIVVLREDGTVAAAGSNDYGQCNVGNWRDIIAISAGSASTMGLGSDGNVYLSGDDDYLYDIARYSDIVYLSAGDYHSVALRSDGTVIALGDNSLGQCNVNQWWGVCQIAAGAYHTVALRIDGAVDAVGDNIDKQCSVHSWREIRSIAAGDRHTIGLDKFGMALAVGNNDFGQCNLSNWREVVSAAAGSSHSIGLRMDGRVVTAGDNSKGQCDVSDWNNIVAVTAGSDHTVGLKADGSVVAVGNNANNQCDVSRWKDVLTVAAGASFTLCLQRDGHVLATGSNEQGQCRVDSWRLKVPSNLEDEEPSLDNCSSVPFRPLSEEVIIKIPNISDFYMKMRLVPPGRYLQGSPNREVAPNSNEIPRHPVWITRPFYIGVTPVTQAQWKSIMHTKPSPFEYSEDSPVVGVSLDDCCDFLGHINSLRVGRFRLPTEAEWEYACRAGTQTVFPWRGNYYNNEIDSHAWYESNAKGVTHPVALKKPNAWGLFDMNGNIYEWCSDWYGPYSQDEKVNPRGPSQGTLKVVRGGSYNQGANACRSAHRFSASPSKRYSDVGFRIIMIPE